MEQPSRVQRPLTSALDLATNHANAGEAAFLQPGSRKEWAFLSLLTCVQVCHVLDFTIIMPLGPQFIRVFSINPGQFGVIVSAYTFAAAASGLVGALWIDRFDRKHALLILFAGFILGTFACAISPTFELLVIARIVAGIFGGTMAGLSMAIVGDMFAEERRGMATGAVMSSFSIASVLGVPFGLFLANHFDWHAPFYFLAILGAIVWFAAFFVLPPIRRHLDLAEANSSAKLKRLAHAEGDHPGAAALHDMEEGGGTVGGQAILAPAGQPSLVTSALGVLRSGQLGKLIEVLINPNHVRAFLLVVCMMIAGFTVIPYISTYMVMNMGLKESDLFYVYLVGGSINFFLARFIGRLADRFGKLRIFTYAALFSVIPIMLQTTMPPVPLTVLLIVSTLFMCSMSARFVPAMSMITSSVKGESRGSFMSVNSSVQSMGSGVAAFLGGAIITELPDGSLAHFDRVGYLACAATLMGIVLARRLKRVD